MRFRLEITTGKSAGKSFSFKSSAIRIGRQPDNDLVLYDTGVSRHHCEIYRSETGYAIRDLESSNGTLVNSQLISDGEIKNGDLIQVGPIIFSFRSGDGIESSPDIDGVAHFGNEDDFESMGETRTTAFASPAGLADEGVGNRTYTGSYLSHRGRSPFFGEMTQKTKISLILSILMVMATILTSTYLLMNPPPPDRSLEFFELSDKSSTDTYGSGRVAVSTPDKVSFKFQSKRGKAVLSYAAGSIDTDKEVSILVNARHVAFVPSSAGKWTTGIKLEIPRRFLVDGLNILTFDNRMTPQHNKRWGIAKVRLIEKELPEPDENKAAELFELANAAYETRSVTPENLYRSIQYYEEATSFLEAMEPSPLLLKEIEVNRTRAVADLEQIYSSHMFAAEKAFRFGDRQAAADKMRALLRHFPDQDDKRYQRAKKKLDGLIGRGELPGNGRP